MRWIEMKFGLDQTIEFKNLLNFAAKFWQGWKQELPIFFSISDVMDESEQNSANI